MKATAVAGMVALGMLAAGVRAQEEAPGVEASLGLPVLSAYVWRGQVLNDETVVQPSLTVGKGGFWLNTWASYNTTDNVTERSGECSEVDLTAAYDFSAGPASYSVGVVEYMFPNTAFSSTAEAFTAIALDNLPVTPAAKVYYDFDEADGFYVNVSLAFSQALGKCLSLDLSGSVGYGFSDYNAFYFGVDDDGLNDGNVGVALAYTVNDAWTVTPALSYSVLVDSDIEDAAAELYFDDSELVASLTAAYTF